MKVEALHEDVTYEEVLFHTEVQNHHTVQMLCQYLG